MNITDAHPSKYLKAASFEMGQLIPVTMAGCEMEDVGTEDQPDTKPVLRFVGKDKGLILNKTNCDALSLMFGPQTEAWVNGRINLQIMMTAYKGTACAGIRIQPPSPPAAAAAPVAAPAPTPLPTREQVQQAADAAMTTSAAQAAGGVGGIPIDEDSIPF